MPFCRSCLILLAAALLFIFNFSVQNVSADWTFDASPPSCYINTSPPSPQYVNTKVTVSVGTNDYGGSGVSSINLSISGPSGASASNYSSSLSYTWNAGTSGSYTLSATVKDAAGNSGSCSGGTYTINPPPPAPATLSAPTVTASRCITNDDYSDVLDISWNKINPAVSWVAIIDPWGTWGWKSVGSNQTSTKGSTGFYMYWSGYSYPFYLYGGYTYKILLYNGSFGPSTSYYVSSCGPPPKPQITYNTSCVTGSYSGKDFTFSWMNNAAPVTTANIYNYYDYYYYKNIPGSANQAVNINGPQGYTTWYNNQALSLVPGWSYNSNYFSNGLSTLGPEIKIDYCGSPPPPQGLSPSCPAPGSPVTLTWNTSTGAWSPNQIYYRTRLGYPQGSGYYDYYQYLDKTSTQYGTNPGTTYNNWGVSACSYATGCSAETPGPIFYCTPPTPPAPPANSMGALCSSGTTANLYWQTAYGVSYKLRIGSNNYDLTNSYYSYTPTTPGATYSDWGVKNCSLGVCSSETAGPAFTCTPSSPPTGSANGTCAAPGTSSRLTWTGTSGATSYDVRIGSNAPRNVSGSPYNYTSLTPGLTYSDWGVRARNTGGPSAETAGQPFTCQPSSSTLNTPDPNNPASPNGGFASCTGNSYNGNLTWGGSPYYTDPDGWGAQLSQWGFWVNIKEGSNFNDGNPSDPYYQKWVACDNPQDRSTCRNTTPVPTGFTFRSNNTSLALNSATTYFYRVFNGNTSTPASLSFSKTCPPSSPEQASLTAACSTPDPNTNLSTANLYLQSAIPGATFYRGKVGSKTADSTFLNVTIPGLTPNASYSWGIAACNTGGCSSETAGSPPLECKPNPAYLKTTGGDVHSNR